MHSSLKEWSSQKFASPCGEKGTCAYLNRLQSLMGLELSSECLWAHSYPIFSYPCSHKTTPEVKEEIFPYVEGNSMTALPSQNPAPTCWHSCISIGHSGWSHWGEISQGDLLLDKSPLLGPQNCKFEHPKCSCWERVFKTASNQDCCFSVCCSYLELAWQNRGNKEQPEVEQWTLLF